MSYTNRSTAELQAEHTYSFLKDHGTFLKEIQGIITKKFNYNVKIKHLQKNTKFLFKSIYFSLENLKTSEKHEYVNVLFNY